MSGRELFDMTVIIATEPLGKNAYHEALVFKVDGKEVNSGKTDSIAWPTGEKGNPWNLTNGLQLPILMPGNFFELTSQQKIQELEFALEEYQRMIESESAAIIENRPPPDEAD